MNENKYFEAIRDLTEEADILNALPNPTHEVGLQILEELIEYLDKLLMGSKEMLDETPKDEIEMIEYIEFEIKLLQFKKDICSKRLEKCREDLKIEEEAQLKPQKNIIFATTDAGNVCVENDIKTIPEEFYESLQNMLLRLQEGVVENNNGKAKRFTSSHRRLSGIHELKEFKVRMFYRTLSDDTVYILMVRMKKADNDRLDHEEIEKRVVMTNKQYEELKAKIKNPILKAQIVQENQAILDDLFEFLKQNKR